MAWRWAFQGKSCRRAVGTPSMSIKHWKTTAAFETLMYYWLVNGFKYDPHVCVCVCLLDAWTRLPDSQTLFSYFHGRVCVCVHLRHTIATICESYVQKKWQRGHVLKVIIIRLLDETEQTCRGLSSYLRAGCQSRFFPPASSNLRGLKPQNIWNLILMCRVIEHLVGASSGLCVCVCVQISGVSKFGQIDPVS